MDNLSKFQKFETIRLNRKDIKNAEYNPRKIGEQEFKRLKKVLKDKGLVMPIVWNERTGNIVGGHQRIKALDQLEKNDSYFIDVAKISVPEDEEIHLNIMLNNESIMGSYDIDLLKDLDVKIDLDLKSVGFSDADVDLIFGGKIKSMLEDTEDVVKTKEKLAEIKANKKEMREKFKEINSAEYYFMVVCDTEAQKVEIMKKMNVQPYERFVMASDFESLIK